ncbi:alpha/beta hydrolase [Brevibacterium daeguense]|uniref:Alpha/beta hydrolase n=1 Tax=Brevibacterium daeguense TaxID=909936 RepID=A0ABP8EKI8_9MICO|nr:alpha/beta hydrolase [Brevibacterium daeguense]
MPKPLSPTSRILRLSALTCGAVLVAGLAGAGGYVLRNTTYARRDHASAAAAGFAERATMINGYPIRYAEGPDNGPALLLIPGQTSDLLNYARVMPALSADFHVYAVDVPGHGGSAWDPELYSGPVLGELFADFVAGVIEEQAIVSGHSSGGLIGAWMGASRPEVVSALVLEDPPFFSSVMPRAADTSNYRDLATIAHRFLDQDGTDDFVAYYLQHSEFFELFGRSADRLRQAGIDQRFDGSDSPVSWPYMPPLMNEFFRGMESYDPHFGQAFYDNSFHDHFNHELTLAAISVPTLLIHCNWQYDDAGLLLAAMTDEDAARALDLIPDCRFARIRSGHSFHFEKPGRFARLVRSFAAETIHEVDVLD